MANLLFLGHTRRDSGPVTVLGINVGTWYEVSICICCCSTGWALFVTILGAVPAIIGLVGGILPLTGNVIAAANYGLLMALAIAIIEAIAITIGTCWLFQQKDESCVQLNFAFVLTIVTPVVGFNATCCDGSMTNRIA